MSTICFLSSMHRANDKRVFAKEAVTLASAGYDVVHICQDEGVERVESGVRTIPLQCRQGIYGRLCILRQLYKVGKGLHADCYHCNELDSWFVGVLLKVIYQHKVIFDVHEHYLSSFFARRFGTFGAFIFSGPFYIVVAILTLLSNRIVLAKKSVAEDYPQKDKHVLVQNFAPITTENFQEPIENHVPAGDEDYLTKVIHTGLISRERGWPQLLEAVAILQDKSIQVHFIGEFNDGSVEDCLREAERLEIKNQIKITSWMRYEEMMEQLHLANVGVVLFQPGVKNHVWALPHKLFDYMYAKLPVVVPEFAIEVANIVQTSQCGLTVKSDNPADIAMALRRVLEDSDHAIKMGKNGRDAVLKKYNWEREGKALIKMYDELLDKDVVV